MKYKLHIPFVNRADLLRDAVESVRAIGNIHVWSDGVKSPPILDVTHHELPPIPFTGVMNFLVRESWNDDVMFFMHNDGFAKRGVAQQLLEFTEQAVARDERFGAIFTHYDVLCVFNMKAVRDIGYWDTMFFQYTSDVDYYYRLRVAGWHELQTLGEGVEHRNDASNTNKADPIFNHRTQFRARNGFDYLYYAFKWGGETGKETFRRPFEDFKP